MALYIELTSVLCVLLAVANTILCLPLRTTTSMSSATLTLVQDKDIHLSSSSTTDSQKQLQSTVHQQVNTAGPMSPREPRDNADSSLSIERHEQTTVGTTATMEQSMSTTDPLSITLREGGSDGPISARVKESTSDHVTSIASTDHRRQSIFRILSSVAQQETNTNVPIQFKGSDMSTSTDIPKVERTLSGPNSAMTEVTSDTRVMKSQSVNTVSLIHTSGLGRNTGGTVTRVEGQERAAVTDSSVTVKENSTGLLPVLHFNPEELSLEEQETTQTVREREAVTAERTVTRVERQERAAVTDSTITVEGNTARTGLMPVLEIYLDDLSLDEQETTQTVADREGVTAENILLRTQRSVQQTEGTAIPLQLNVALVNRSLGQLKRVRNYSRGQFHRYSGFLKSFPSLNHNISTMCSTNTIPQQTRQDARDCKTLAVVAATLTALYIDASRVEAIDLSDLYPIFSSPFVYNTLGRAARYLSASVQPSEALSIIPTSVTTPTPPAQTTAAFLETLSCVYVHSSVLIDIISSLRDCAAPGAGPSSSGPMLESSHQQ